MVALKAGARLANVAFARLPTEQSLADGVIG